MHFFWYFWLSSPWQELLEKKLISEYFLIKINKSSQWMCYHKTFILENTQNSPGKEGTFKVIEKYIKWSWFSVKLYSFSKKRAGHGCYSRILFMSVGPFILESSPQWLFPFKKLFLKLAALSVIRILKKYMWISSYLIKLGSRNFLVRIGDCNFVKIDETSNVINRYFRERFFENTSQ